MKRKMQAARQKHLKPKIGRAASVASVYSVFSDAIDSARSYVRRGQRKVTPCSWPQQVLFVSLLVLIALAALFLGSIEPWWTGIFESAIYVLGACSIIATFGKHWNLPVILAPLAALVLLACFQLLPLYRKAFVLGLDHERWQALSLNPFETKRFAIRLGATALMLAMLLRFTLSRRQLIRLTQFVIIIGVVSAAFAMWRLLFPHAVPASLVNYKLPHRGLGQFANRNHFALLMEMSLGPTLALAFHGWSGSRRFLYLEIALFFCVVLISANSRGGIISMMGELAFLLWIYLGARVGGAFLSQQWSTTNGMWKKLWRVSQVLVVRLVIILLLLGVVAAGIVSLGGERVRERLESVHGEFLPRTDNLQSQNPRRLEIWIATLRLIETHPVLGSGLGAYETAVARYLKSGGDWQPQQAHNDYLELVAGGGIVGGAIAICFFLILIRESRKQLSDPDPVRRVLCQGALAGLVGVAIHSLVDFGLHAMANALVCCCLIALATVKVHSTPIESSFT